MVPEKSPHSYTGGPGFFYFCRFGLYQHYLVIQRPSPTNSPYFLVQKEDFIPLRTACVMECPPGFPAYPLTPVCFIPLRFTDLRIWSFPDLRTPVHCRRQSRKAFHAFFFLSFFQSNFGIIIIFFLVFLH